MTQLQSHQKRPVQQQADAYRSPASTELDDKALDSEDISSRWTGAWLRDSGLMVFSQGALTAIATLVMILLARNLPKYQFGLFASFLGVAQAFSFVVDAGLTTWLLRECSRIRASGVPRNHQDAHIAQLLGNALHAVTYTGILAVLGSIAIGLALGLGPELSLAQGAFMAYIAMLAAATGLEANLRSERRLGQVLSAILLEKASMLVLVGIVLLALDGGLVMVGIVYLVAGLLRVLLDYHRSLRPLGSPNLLVKPRTIIPTLKATAPFALNSTALTFLPRLDTAVVAAVSVIGASYYGLGYQVVTTAQIIPAIAAITLLPHLTANHGVQGSQWKIFGAMSGIGVLVAGIGVLLSPFVIPLLFGDEYRPAVGAIQIMICAIPFIFAYSAIMPFLYNQGHERDVLRWVLLPSVLGTCLVLVGEATVGPSGAAFGLVARYLFVTISFVLLSFRKDSRRASEITPEPQFLRSPS